MVDFYTFLTTQKNLYLQYKDDIVSTGGNVEQLEAILFEKRDQEAAEYVIADILFLLDDMSPSYRESALYLLYATSRLTYVRMWQAYLEQNVEPTSDEIVNAVYQRYRELRASYEAVTKLPDVIRHIVKKVTASIDRVTKVAVENSVEALIAELAKKEQQ